MYLRLKRLLQKRKMKQKQIKKGISYHPLYDVHRQMLKRCTDPKNKDYKHYGARGIKISIKWSLFENFVKDMYPTYKKGLTLDRIDNNKEYSKRNCRWIPQSEQTKNQRSNIIYKGECASDASRRLKGNKSLVRRRIKIGWSKQRAFTTLARKITL